MVVSRWLALSNRVVLLSSRFGYSLCEEAAEEVASSSRQVGAHSAATYQVQVQALVTKGVLSSQLLRLVGSVRWQCSLPALLYEQIGPAFSQYALHMVNDNIFGLLNTRYTNTDYSVIRFKIIIEASLDGLLDGPHGLLVYFFQPSLYNVSGLNYPWSYMSFSFQASPPSTHHYRLRC